MLVLYAISPILVHGTELGRPDHQSLLILLMTIAICAEWNLQSLQAAGIRSDAIRESRIASKLRRWSATGGAAWAVAIWVSSYEPFVLFLIVMGTVFLVNRQSLFLKDRCPGWISFVVILAVALLIERRIPPLADFVSNPIFQNWARTIGELKHVAPTNLIWVRWCGYLLVVTPLLIWISITKTRNKSEEAMPTFVLVLFVATYVLTVWQARWGYFFVLIFALVLPCLLEPIKSRAVVWIAFLLSIFPILRDWDEKLWPNEAQLANRMAHRYELAQLRDLALNLRSSQLRPFVAPWWLSPEIAYWSGQPGVAGSSHESLPGIEDSARFFVGQDWETARKLLENHKVSWVIAYDPEHVAQNSAEILGITVPQQPVCFVLNKTATRTPPFLVLSVQNGSTKLYSVVPR